jgi:enoyl-[acyl-carrier-protein] reductase (NADH)
MGRVPASTITLGRKAAEIDLGGDLIFLLSPLSAWINGINLPVEGGYTVKQIS